MASAEFYVNSSPPPAEPLKSSSKAAPSDAVSVVPLSAPLPPVSQESAPPLYKLDETYKIGVDDVLQVSVWRNPDLSVTVPVRPDGKISAPLIGDILVGGRSPQDVANQIKRHLEEYIRDPHVSVILQELKSHEFLSRVRVTGAVKAPISVPFRQGMSVLDLVLVAGGVNEFASENKTKLYRKQDGKTISMDVYLKDILRKGDLETNFTLLPGDIITIPEKLF